MATVKQNVPYYVEMDFSNSIISISDFFTCPHFEIEVAMIPLNEAKD